MDTTALLLSRLQFAFTISFHIIFPAFSIGLAAWLTVLECQPRRNFTRNQALVWCFFLANV